jgi:lactate permease
MTAFLALLPCAVVVFAVITLRLSGLAAAACALITALALWASGVFSPVQLNHLGHAITDSIVLELLVGVVIFLGLLFVEVSGRSGGLGALGDAINALSLAPSRAIILITLGIGVMLESLTGYGVSMLVTVPLLLQRVDRTKTICLALIGMSLMPWGALSIAALLGAELSGLPTQALADAIVTTSGPIAAVLPLFCLLFAPRSSLQDVIYALFVGATLTFGIAATSYWIGVEAAGVGGGLAVIIVSLVFSSSRRDLGQVLARPALLPYGLLIAAVVLQKLSVPHFAAVGISPAIETGRVSFDVIGSPGIALLTVALICIAWRVGQSRSGSDQPLLQHVTSRSWRALASIFFFLMTARLLVEIGGIASLAGKLSQLGIYPAVVAVTILGGIGAYVTGSGVTANALFMPSAAATGQNFDALALFAALQHSGAAHVAMASLPVIAILLAALPNRDASDERTAMRMGLGLAVLWILFVVASGSAQLATAT